MAVEMDSVVKMAIEDLFQDQTVPDEDNYRPDGTQFKAPDHSIWGGKVLIERKSRNTRDCGKIYKRLQAIAAEQGAPFYALGRIRIDKIINSLPDPSQANKKLADYNFNQLMKSVQNSKRKFDEYEKHRSTTNSACVLIISDNSKIIESTATIEQYIGRRMGGYDRLSDVTGHIDAIFFIKDPNLTLDEQNSYWFKAVVKSSTSGERRGLIEQLAAALHYRIGHYGDYFEAAQQFRNGSFRLLIA